MTDDELIAQALSILKSRLRKSDRCIKHPADAANYLSLQFAGLEHESFRVMFLDNRHGVIAFEELFRGTIDTTTVYPREIVKAALHFNAAAVILTHNHPSGNSQPSEADKLITRRVTDALGLIDIRVLDHIVIGGADTYSFARHGLI